MLSDEEIHKVINSYFTKKQGNPVFISKEILHTIKIQFIALGLISNDGLTWDLTERGKTEMINCRAIRK